jgi:hypothetical protein
MELEHTIQKPWYELTTDQIIATLLDHGIDAKFIKKYYRESIEAEEKRQYMKL